MIGRALLGVVWVLAVAFALPPLPTAEETMPPAPGQDAPVIEPTVEPSVEPAPEPAAPPAPEPSPGPAPATVPPSDPPPPPVAPSAPPEPSAAKPKPPRAFAAAPGSVSISDFAFRPSSITVGVGETVTWRNNDSAAHTATATDGSFDTGLMDRGESGSATFEEAGTFSYLCEPHPFMKGTVRVVAQTSSGGGESDGSGSDDTSTGTSGSTSTGTAADTSGSDTLPATGADPLPLGLTGIGLLLIGMVGRRRAVT